MTAAVASAKPGQYTTMLEVAGEPALDGRLQFAGEHTSSDFLGYMNGGVQSGNRAAAALIAAIWHVTGEGALQPIRAVQVLLSLLTSVFVFAIGRRVWNARVGAIGAAIAWLDPTAIYLNSTILTETLFTTLLVAFVLATVMVVQTRTWASALICGLALGLGVTRIGCFLNGCCYGRPTSGPLGVVFPPGSHAGIAFAQTPLHPTQLYTSAVGFSIMLVLLIVERRLPGMGQLFGLYLALEGPARIAMDFVRAYAPGTYVTPGITAHQLIALGLTASGLLLLVRGARPT